MEMKSKITEALTISVLEITAHPDEKINPFWTGPTVLELEEEIGDTLSCYLVANDVASIAISIKEVCDESEPKIIIVLAPIETDPNAVLSKPLEVLGGLMFSSEDPLLRVEPKEFGQDQFSNSTIFAGMVERSLVIGFPNSPDTVRAYWNHFYDNMSHIHLKLKAMKIREEVMAQG